MGMEENERKSYIMGNKPLPFYWKGKKGKKRSQNTDFPLKEKGKK